MFRLFRSWICSEVRIVISNAASKTSYPTSLSMALKWRNTAMRRLRSDANRGAIYIVSTKQGVQTLLVGKTRDEHLLRCLDPVRQR